MRCTHCGAIIPDDMLYCPECNMEVQIVPDYNPLEDILAREVKGSVEDATRQIKTDDIRRYRRGEAQEYNNSTRVLSQNELDEMRSRRSAAAQERRAALDSQQKRRQQIARKKRLAKKRRKRALIILLILVVLAGVSGFFLYQNSYAGQMNKGNQALQSGEYAAAEIYFKNAISKNEKKAEAYTGLSKVYVQQDDPDGAEAVFLTAISSQPSNVELYRAAINFYIDTDQLIKISELLDNCEDDEVLKEVRAYVSNAPEFSLEEGTYSEVQEVSLSSSGETIYYTTDGSEPDTSSEKYTEPILLPEGETTIMAISVNKKEIPSLTVSKVYTIDIPVADAPAVTPSTGQYNGETQITINVPDGYTAYYTLDGSEPTDASAKYEGPINMPEGQTMFSAILVSKQGKYTQVTKRNYVLDPAG
ncbi:chitobiase/beta-hexosaminidase C-terminal domain-containing protein [Clostridium sp. C105KSO13]|uniref:chitobiase/beta-hexosaminidase C-terminal domain-containing protein n=1 Tax=Clostridium sp. C105KSO13 TaxID=1776045 RepID=UPI0007407B20|nr:chitobiase/beta-hexosaminidase C-terminal domain-containing protein [Clostridium sp. C105KSO13]CUX50154.1 Tetratricopeptide repeat protein [Clostridium sp. C105KSO13]